MTSSEEHLANERINVTPDKIKQSHQIQSLKIHVLNFGISLKHVWGF